LADERKGQTMQSVIQVTCYRGGSLREALANDKYLAKYHLAVSRQKTSGRNPGWAKLHSTEPDVHGARVVTKHKSTPDRITGDFIAYLIRRQRTRIRSILLLPG
jgi:hypothetical protein